MYKVVPSPGMAERGVTGLLKVGTMMTIGGMTNGWRAVMVNGEFRRLGGDDGSGWYCDGYGYTWQQEPVQSAELSASHDKGLMSKRLAVSAA